MRQEFADVTVPSQEFRLNKQDVSNTLKTIKEVV